MGSGVAVSVLVGVGVVVTVTVAVGVSLGVIVTVDEGVRLEVGDTGVLVISVACGWWIETSSFTGVHAEIKKMKLMERIKKIIFFTTLKFFSSSNYFMAKEL